MTRGSRSLCLALLLGAPAFAPAAESVSASTPRFTADTARVRVDLVVRDKKGAILRGLDAASFEVYEDGVRQDIDGLEFVETRPEGASDPSEAPAGSNAGARTPAVVAIAFDRLSPGGRRFAHQAVLDYLGRANPGTWVGLFSIDRDLRTLQPLTGDRAALRRSADRLLSMAPTSLAGLRERKAISNAHAGLATGMGQSHVASAEFAGTPECRGNETDAIRSQELLESRMVESFAALERDVQGFSTSEALLALIAGLETLPGRKAIVLFSEGVAIPAGVDATFRSVVAAANRANVSFYAADAAGLRVASSGLETRREVETVMVRSGPPDLSSMGTGSRSRPELIEDTLRLAPEAGLGRLALETGGFLISDTNDLGSGLLEMDEELGAYYVLSYAPKKQEYDGRFRSLTVKLQRPHGRLQARKGYLALNTALPVPTLEHEAPALARLEGSSRPTDIPLRLRGLQFPEEPASSVASVVVEVPADSLEVVRDTKAGVFRQDFTILVLVRDGGGRVVAKLSQHYPLTGPLKGRSDPRLGQVLFYREARLPAGSYALEAIAYDALSGKAGTAAATLEVPVSLPQHLRASSLMVVRSAEKVGASPAAAPRPFLYRDVVLYPNLGQAVKRETGGALAFFVTAWPTLERPALEARVEVWRDGKSVAQTPPERLRADGDGRVQLASSLPLESLVPGAYELRVTLSDGRDQETRTAQVPIAR